MKANKNGTVSEWLPWYQIAWNLLWAIPFVASLSLLAVCVFAMKGPSEARATWKRVW